MLTPKRDKAFYFLHGAVHVQARLLLRRFLLHKRAVAAIGDDVDAFEDNI